MTQANNVGQLTPQVNSSGVLQVAGGGTGLAAVGTSGYVLASNGATNVYVNAVGYSGTSGYSGYSGGTGSNGASGTSGYSGATGSAGTSGFSGFSGYSGSAASVIPSGSVFLLYQSSAPTGWTQVTSLNDYDLRLTSGAGGSTGGTTAYSTVFTNQTPTINVSGLSAGATTLSTSQIPSHNHSAPGNSQYQSQAGSCGANAFLNNQSTGDTGGGGSHTHSISGSATSSAITLNVRYANVIICSKN
jgi:hypothetical protein